jgi:glycosyltransferase involved in cell wall biosynthesis
MNDARLRVGFFFFGGVLHRVGSLYHTRVSIFNMLRHLPRFWDVTFVFPEMDDDGAAGETYSFDLGGAETISVPGWRDGIDLYTRQLPRILFRVLRIIGRSRKRWDLIIICDTVPASQFAMLCAKLRGIPLAFYLRGNPQIEVLQRNKTGIRHLAARLWSAYLEKFLPIVFQRSAVIVTGSHFLKSFPGVEHIHPFVATPFSEDMLPKTAPDRDFAAVPLRALFVGNITALKGVDTSLKAIKAAKDQGIEVFLDIIGRGPFLDRCKEISRNLQVSANVSFQGFVPFGEGLFEAYRASHVFLLPSLSEGTPKVVVEAMAFGLPIIASRVGGIPDLVEDGETGFLIEPGDYDAVAARLISLGSDRERLRRMSGNCFARASEFTIEAQVSALTKFLRSDVCCAV